MVHCGYEPTAVSETFGSLKGFLATVKLTLLGAKPERLDDLPTLSGKNPAPTNSCNSKSTRIRRSEQTNRGVLRFGLL